jgi:glucose-1-phosphate cytidylyltransferase
MKKKNIKAVILAGGFGTRLSEETYLYPKPMIYIGGKPILWHILKIYSNYGINEFVICCGYKGYVIKEYFSNYSLHMSDVTLDISNNNMKVHHNRSESWKITLIDTGEHSMTGGRLKRVSEYIKNEDFFCFTYGDGLSDININETIDFHMSHGKLATVSAVYPTGRFGALKIKNNQIIDFEEKPKGDGAMINGGFFVLSPKVLDFIKDDKTIWEQETLKLLAKNKELVAYKHNGFWQPMDTARDKETLEKLWNSGMAPWKKWK